MFMQHFIESLKAGGRAAIVIKNTFLSNSDASAIRKLLLDECNLHTILDCPQKVFTAGIKTVVLFFEKGRKTKNIWYYQMDVGRSLGKTNPLNDADLAEFIALQKNFTDSDKSWTIDIDTVNTESYDLSLKNPNTPEEEPLRAPEVIIEDMLSRDKETANILANIRAML